LSLCCQVYTKKNNSIAEGAFRVARKKTTKGQDVGLDKADTIDAEVLETMPADAEGVIEADGGQASSKGVGLKPQLYLIPMFLGGLCAGAIGYCVAVLPDYFNSNDQLSSLLLDQKEIHDQIVNLSETVSEIRNVGPSANFSEELDPLRISLSKLSAGIKVRSSAQEIEITALKERIYLLENRPLNGEVSASVIQNYERELTQIRAEIEAILIKAAGDVEQAQGSAAMLEVAAQAISQENVAASALIGIEAAISNGTGYSTLLEELKAILGLNLPEVLSTNAQLGVVTLNKLQDEFPKLARVSLKAARREGEGTGFGAFLKAQLGFRSLFPREGTSPDAVLSRAEASVAAGNLQVALVELIDLPKSGQLVLQDWSERARARLSVLKAISELTRTMVVN
jgi:hypothetical protein